MTSKLFTTLAAATTLAGIVTTAGAANAASLTQTASTDFETTNIIDQRLSIQKFDSSLGTLKGVTLQFTGDLKGEAGYENRSATASRMTVILASQLSLKLNNQTLFDIAPVSSNSYDATRYDGTSDYSGSSGKTIQGITATQSNTTTLTDNNYLSHFIGTGNLNFLFSAIATSDVSGSGNMRSYVDTLAKASLVVNYDYEAPKPVPEPSALLGIGLAGVGIFLQSKKNRLKTSNS